jgi:hypothetical protein
MLLSRLIKEICSNFSSMNSASVLRRGGRGRGILVENRYTSKRFNLTLNLYGDNASEKPTDDGVSSPSRSPLPANAALAAEAGIFPPSSASAESKSGIRVAKFMIIEP